MRLKNVPGAREAVGQSEWVVNTPAEYRGRWREAFGRRAPLSVEIGMGKGQFLVTLAGQHPEQDFVGIEKYSSVLIRAVEKQEELALPNLRLLRLDAELLEEVFAPGEVDRIYLNFSDPWPKERHAKRRLTSPDYLARYRRVLAEGGQVEFKTDNTDLFSWSLGTIESEGWRILACTRDLHHDPELVRGNVMTEYEARFSAQGNPICKVIFALDRSRDEFFVKKLEKNTCNS